MKDGRWKVEGAWKGMKDNGISGRREGGNEGKK